MTNMIPFIVENGILRPLIPVDLREGETINVPIENTQHKAVSEPLSERQILLNALGDLISPEQRNRPEPTAEDLEQMEREDREDDELRAELDAARLKALRELVIYPHRQSEYTAEELTQQLIELQSLIEVDDINLVDYIIGERRNGL